uniref:Mitochondrial ribosomal protein S21 n=1 Tax=Cyprinus carpio carpio TaxID=630221 RepID=A0A9J7Z3D5_CYPCA
MSKYLAAIEILKDVCEQRIHNSWAQLVWCCWEAFGQEVRQEMWLHRVLSSDGIIESVKRRRYYEKPCRERERKSYEDCKRIYNSEMARKIYFVSRTQRQDPWLGC